ncbi:UNVERIFIED_CONTAM: hypothetical protein B566_EDAN018787, partial [Ephemera danica]
MASVDDDFEYYIKFPPSRRTSNVDSEEWSRFTGDENKKLPVIVLLGWAGCQDKYLCKYSAIYEERGLITLRTTAPLQTLFVHRASMSELAAKLVDTLYDMNLHQHPLVFHLFSNGGSYLYGHVLKGLALGKATPSRRERGVPRSHRGATYAPRHIQTEGSLRRSDRCRARTG